MARHDRHRDNGHDEWFYPAKPSMSGRFDQDGRLIINEATTRVEPGLSASEIAGQSKAHAYDIAKVEGEVPQWRQAFDTYDRQRQ